MSTQPISEGHDPRVVRARSLANELVETMQRIAGECRGPDAVLFLELVERCNGYTESELTLADASETMAMAREVLAVDGAIISTAAASALDIDGIADRLWDALEPDASPVVPLVLDALTLATIAHALPAGRKQDAEDATDQVVALIESHPELFEEAVAIAIDRARFERPSKLQPGARDLIRVLRSLPELADEDLRAEYAELPPFALNNRTSESALEEALEHLGAALAEITALDLRYDDEHRAYERVHKEGMDLRGELDDIRSENDARRARGG